MTANRSTAFNPDHCPIARTSSLVGDAWTPLVIRELFVGNRKFGELESALGISKAVLTQRLNQLVENGIITKRPYQDRPARYEYVLTERGEALWDVLLAMWSFGDEWLFRDRAGLEMVHSDTAEPIEPIVVDRSTREPIELSKTRLRIRQR